MGSKVYFCDLRTRSEGDNKSNKIGRLFDAAGLGGAITDGGLIAVKVHFGERGNDSFMSPVLVRRVVDKVKEAGGKPFLTDTATLYSGSRRNAADHVSLALEHGFGMEVTGAPIIIADGLRGGDFVEAPIDGKHLKSAKIASGLAEADGMIVVSHFKGHEMAGFGGAVKNLAMGGAPPIGKKEQHSARMAVNQDECVACGNCAEICPEGAIAIGSKASIDAASCIGCGECLQVCPEKAIDLDWETDVAEMMERMAEYALGAASLQPGRIGYINLLMSITPDCDCAAWSDAPLVPDIGMLSSLDPVALDQACWDLVSEQVGLAASKLEAGHAAGEDKFAGAWPNTSPDVQLRHAESLGLGSREYELIRL